MIEFKKEDFIIDIVEASRPEKGSPLMDAHERDIKVYHLDGIKKWWCKRYRNNNELRSCDAYYGDSDNHLVIEFKNTHHQNMKSYMNEIQEKIVDSHMILAETVFCGIKKSKIKNYHMLLVYNDSLKYYSGVQNIANALNGMKPFSGNQNRSSSEKECYKTEEEYQLAVQAIKSLFEGSFFDKVDFIDKNDFYEFYINGKYFKPLIGC